MCEAVGSNPDPKRGGKYINYNMLCWCKLCLWARLLPATVTGPDTAGGLPDVVGLNIKFLLCPTDVFFFDAPNYSR